MAAGAAGRQPRPPARQGRQRDARPPRRRSSAEPAPALVLLCDGDLGDLGGAALAPLVEAVERGSATSPWPPSAVASAAASASRSASPAGRSGASAGFEAEAPISGQRALRVEVLRATLPFARGYGMEIGMTVDAVRAGYRVARVRARPRPPRDRPRPARLPPSRPPAAPTSPASTLSAAGRGHHLVEGTIANSTISGAISGSCRRRPAAISCWMTPQVPPPIASRITAGTALPSGGGAGPRKEVKVAEHAIGVVERRRARHRQVEEGHAGEELVVGGVVEQRADAGRDRLRPLGLALRRRGDHPQSVFGEQVEAGEEGLLLAREVVVEGLVGDPGGG